MTEAVICHDKSWLVSQDSKAKAAHPEVEDKQSETVEALLRASKEPAQKAATDRATMKEAVPAK